MDFLFSILHLFVPTNKTGMHMYYSIQLLSNSNLAESNRVINKNSVKKYGVNVFCENPVGTYVSCKFL